jgi:cation diffusion facilitator CzcD-associated flavoprotein CzcO
VIDEALHPSHVQVAVVGAGFSGIGMAIKLREAGIHDFAVFEKGDGIGGTWHDHVYPGLVCDIPSHFYSFSYELNPEWSHVFPPQPEIKAYIEHCVDKYGLRPHIHTRAPVHAARFEASAGCWRLAVGDGAEVTAQVLVSAIGGLSRYCIPEFPGLAAFEGAQFHTARWPSDFDPAGRRIAVIGSAASAIQIVPEIAKTAAQVYVFQRTPNWIFPRPDAAYTAWRKRLYRRFPALMRLYRWALYGFLDFVGFRAFRVRSLLRRLREWQAKRFIRHSVEDPALWEKLIPDYPSGCKRVLLSSDFYPALNRENVTLVTEGIDGIQPSHVETTAGPVGPIDNLVFATGYHVTDPLGPLEVRGADGRELREVWGERMCAYKGISMHGFPNLFFLLGPNTALGHSSIIFMVEQQVKYTVQCIQRLHEGEYMDVRHEAMAHYNAWLHPGFQGKVWTQCASWYRDATGKNPTLWPHSTTAYWRMMRKPKFSDYTFTKSGG